jgi:hypothetical protein
MTKVLDNQLAEEKCSIVVSTWAHSLENSSVQKNIKH